MKYIILGGNKKQERRLDKKRIKIRDNKIFVILLILASSILFIATCLFKMIMGQYFAILISFLLIILLLSFNCKKNIWALCFYVTFFTFLLGRFAVNIISGNGIALSFKEETLTHIAIVLEISIVTFGLSFFSFIEGKKKHKPIQLLSTPKTDNSTIQKACLILFWITFPFYLAVGIERALFVQKNSYIEYYTRFQSVLPTVFNNIAAIYEIVFFVFLATLPKKKQTFKVLVIYLLSSAISLLYGQRNGFMLALVIVVAYVIWRSAIDTEEEHWFTKKSLLIGLIAGPILLALMFAFNEYRSGIEVSTKGFLNQVIAFFKQQGGSIEVIGYGYEYKSLFNQDVNYALSQITSVFIENRVISKLFNVKIYSGQTVETALYGHNYGGTLTYLVMPNNYLNGMGIGTSYLAEIYHEYGYIGIILINILYAFLFSKMTKKIKIHPCWGGILFIMLKNIIYAPRASAFSFLAKSFTITTIGAMLVIVLVSEILKEYDAQKNKGTM